MKLLPYPLPGLRMGPGRPALRLSHGISVIGDDDLISGCDRLGCVMMVVRGESWQCIYDGL
jgi:hypothetical protein